MRLVPASAQWPKAPKRWLQTGGVLAGISGLAVTLMCWRSTIAPVFPTAYNIYSIATIERCRQLVALGNCVGCHTTSDGAPNAGGRALDTPFGRVWIINLTPDLTKIG